MKVKDVILKACDFIGKDELALALSSSGELSAEQQVLKESLVKYFNLVREEIANEFQPIMQAEKFIVRNFKLSFSDFSKPLQEIYAVKDKFGRNVNYKIFEDYIFVCGREVEVIYSSVATPLAFDGEFSSSLPERIYAYGVAREYYFINNLFEEANVWEGRFKGALEIMLRRKSEVKIPQRRWI
ncbi:MAG: hypothetical protein J6A28_04700 [Clostridia bacterium]|nr:hypothetical protein [Clostridia bacterium]